jgi:mycofactocin precursor
MRVMPHNDVSPDNVPTHNVPTHNVTELVGASVAPGEDEAELVEEEILVEEISIDGMCGVY